MSSESFHLFLHKYILVIHFINKLLFLLSEICFCRILVRVLFTQRQRIPVCLDQFDGVDHQFPCATATIRWNQTWWKYNQCLDKSAHSEPVGHSRNTLSSLGESSGKEKWDKYDLVEEWMRKYKALHKGCYRINTWTVSNSPRLPTAMRLWLSLMARW